MRVVIVDETNAPLKPDCSNARDGQEKLQRLLKEATEVWRITPDGFVLVGGKLARDVVVVRPRSEAEISGEEAVQQANELAKAHNERDKEFSQDALACARRALGAD